MRIAAAFLGSLLLSAPAVAETGFYLTGSLASSTSSMPYNSYSSNYGSASIGIDLGSLVRLSLTHSQEISTQEGFKDKQDRSGDANPANDEDPANDGDLVSFANTTHVVGNSVDLQLILYEGMTFVPYVTGGLILKSYHFIQKEEGKEAVESKLGPIPGPNLGAGVGLKLNKQFTLKLAYIASPGYVRQPFDAETRTVWDKKVTLGLTYQL
jgi:hypothetical protein